MNQTTIRTKISKAGAWLTDRAIAALIVVAVFAIPAFANVKKLEWNNILTAIQSHDKLQQIGLNANNDWQITGGNLVPNATGTKSLGTASLAWSNLFSNGLNLSAANTNGAVNLGDTAVTQLTSITTGVTSNTPSGRITTVSLTTAARTVAGTFTVTCGSCASTSVVTASISGYSGALVTNGFPYITVGAVANGSFAVTVANSDATNPLSGTLTISYVVQ